MYHKFLYPVEYRDLSESDGTSEIAMISRGNPRAVPVLVKSKHFTDWEANNLTHKATIRLNLNSRKIAIYILETDVEIFILGFPDAIDQGAVEQI